MRRYLLTLPLLVAAAPAPPHTQPARDVEIVYRVGPVGYSIEERARFEASSGRERVDAPGGHGSYMVSDHHAGTVTIVNQATRQIVQTAVGAKPPPSQYLRGQARTIAGLACTDWSIVAPAGSEPDTLCLTNDGVMLRLAHGGTEQALATSVRYATVDPALFTIPADYMKVTRPAPPK